MSVSDLFSKIANFIKNLIDRNKINKDKVGAGLEKDLNSAGEVTDYSNNALRLYENNNFSVTQVTKIYSDDIVKLLPEEYRTTKSCTNLVTFVSAFSEYKSQFCMPGAHLLDFNDQSEINCDLVSNVILDIGSGNGVQGYLLQKMGWKVVGLEPNIDKKPLIKTVRGAYIKGKKLPFKDRSFDLVVSNATVHLLDFEVVGEIERVLKPHGSYIGAEIFGRVDEKVKDLNPLFKFIRPFDEWAAWFAKYFKIMKVHQTYIIEDFPGNSDVFIMVFELKKKSLAYEIEVVCPVCSKRHSLFYSPFVDLEEDNIAVMRLFKDYMLMYCDCGELLSPDHCVDEKLFLKWVISAGKLYGNFEQPGIEKLELRELAMVLHNFINSRFG